MSGCFCLCYTAGNMAGKTQIKPRVVSSEQVQEVLRRIEEGQSERSACKDVGVNRASFRSAALKDEAADHYARALQGLATDQIEKLELAIDDMRSGKIDASMARVEIEARKWFASKFLPKQYGDKVDVTSGGEKLAPVLVKFIDGDARNTDSEGV